jgi:hypothetical protein
MAWRHQEVMDTWANNGDDDRLLRIAYMHAISEEFISHTTCQICMRSRRGYLPCYKEGMQANLEEITSVLWKLLMRRRKCSLGQQARTSKWTYSTRPPWSQASLNRRTKYISWIHGEQGFWQLTVSKSTFSAIVPCTTNEMLKVVIWQTQIKMIKPLIFENTLC